MIDRAPGERSATGPSERAVRGRGEAPPSLTRELDGLRRELVRSAALELERVRAAGHAGVALLTRGAVAALAGATLVVLATGYLVAGVVGAIAAATTPWFGRLGGGLLLLLLVGGGLEVWRRRRDRALAARLLREEDRHAAVRERTRGAPTTDPAANSTR